METTTVTNLDQAITEFIALVQDVTNKYYERTLSNLKPPTIVRAGGRKFIKIMSDENGGQRIVAFIAAQDGNAKATGPVTMGDVMKPATWATPAKHPRGNIFHVDGGASAVDPHGSINYMG